MIAKSIAKFCRRHCTQEVSSHDEADVLFRELSAKQVSGEVDYLGSIGEARHAAISIEVCAETNMLYAHYLCCMAKVFDSVDNGGLPFLAKETIIDGCLCNAVCFGESPHLVVREVAWVVAKGAC